MYIQPIKDHLKKRRTWKWWQHWKWTDSCHFTNGSRHQLEFPSRTLILSSMLWNTTTMSCSFLSVCLNFRGCLHILRLYLFLGLSSFLSSACPHMQKRWQFLGKDVYTIVEWGRVIWDEVSLQKNFPYSHGIFSLILYMIGSSTWYMMLCMICFMIWYTIWYKYHYILNLLLHYK